MDVGTGICLNRFVGWGVLPPCLQLPNNHNNNHHKMPCTKIGLARPGLRPCLVEPSPLLVHSNGLAAGAFRPCTHRTPQITNLVCHALQCPGVLCCRQCMRAGHLEGQAQRMYLKQRTNHRQIQKADPLMSSRTQVCLCIIQSAAGLIFFHPLISSMTQLLSLGAQCAL